MGIHDRDGNTDPCHHDFLRDSLSYKAPEKINWLYGYRTRRSMLNKDTWSYAHRYIGKLWLSMGTCMVVITMIVVLLELRNSSDLSVLITVLQMIPLIGSLFLTESALKKNI